MTGEQIQQRIDALYDKKHVVCNQQKMLIDDMLNNKELSNYNIVMMCKSIVECDKNIERFDNQINKLWAQYNKIQWV